MASPFTGAITSTFKTRFKQAIDALLEDAACTVPCRIYYGTTKYENCPKCEFSNLGRRGASPYISGGKNHFPNTQQCEVCGGTRKRPVESTDDINIIVIFDYVQFARKGMNLNIPEGSVVTFCKKSLVSKLKNAKYVVFDTDIEEYTKHSFVRDGEPTPMGLGENAYILTIWKRK